MRTILLGLSTIAIVVLADSPPAAAQTVPAYPWCAALSDDGGAPESCAFDNQRQCLDYISGLGGACYLNPYFGPAALATPQAPFLATPQPFAPAQPVRRTRRAS
jgi:hypothetical protein